MASGFLIEERLGFHEGLAFFSRGELREEAFRIETTLEAPEDSVSSVTTTLDDLAGAIVRQATITVAAKAPGTASIHSVAQVRAAAGDPDAASRQLIVDFQGLRTVSRVRAPSTMTAITPWVGTRFADDAITITTSSTAEGMKTFDFVETLAERLLVDFGSGNAVDPAELAASGAVTIPTPPADLELVVNGIRSWFNAGPARPSPPPEDDEAAEPEYRADVDLTDVIRKAVEAGALPIVVELRSSTPGQLAVAAQLDVARTHTVQFPEGARAIEAAEEGDVTLAVPLPEDAGSWRIEGVEVTVSGAPGAVRVLRPGLPPLSPDAELLLDPDHAAVVRLPGDATARLAKLTALRLPVLAGPDGAELSGTLLTDVDGEPGEPVPDGELGPVVVPPGSGPPAWVTLPFAPARDPEPLWASIAPARGSVTWPLAATQVDPDPGARAPGPGPDPRLNALLRRRAANGRFKPLSAPDDVDTGAATVRVAGEPPPNAPIAPAEARVAGEALSVPFTPSADGVTVSLRLAAPVEPGNPTARAGGALQLVVTAWTPGTLAFRDVRIAYTEMGAET